MPPQRQHRPGSSRLCKLQVMNTVGFTAGANSRVPKSLVHARVVIHRGSAQLRTASLQSCGAEYRRFRNRLEHGTLIPPPSQLRCWGPRTARTRHARHLTCARCTLVCDTMKPV